MSLTQINIHNLRNIKQLKLSFNPRFNIFHGVNGSGKTSLLEAIYLLSNGRSFRSREIEPILRFNEDMLTVFAKLGKEDAISIQKTKAGSTIVKLNHQSCKRASDLARFLPCQVIYQDIFQIIDAGPAIRRNVLDWGLFHQDKGYNKLLTALKQILKQRGALLRQKSPAVNFKPWDNLLVDISLEIDKIRGAYFKELSLVFQMILAKLTNTACNINYYRGWDKKGSGLGLTDILREQLESDIRRQYTNSGAHQADILFDSIELKAKSTLSRGQQKIILIALKLAQSYLLADECVYLFDDVASELDRNHLGRLLDLLQEIKGQFFFTAIDPQQLLFHTSLNQAMLFPLDSLHNL